MTNVILCGGSGTRLWPISRSLFPKQFYKFIDNMSLFQKTALRNKGFCDNFLVVTNIEQYFIALDQIEEIGIKNFRFIIEPVARNTAAAISLSCFDALDYKEELLFVTPSDHIIKGDKDYVRMVNIAQNEAKNNYIAMFGIKPSYPETGYGYIEADINIKDIDINKNNIDINGNSADLCSSEDIAYCVSSFKEKPSKETAIKYISKGNYFWNSGAFLFKPSILLNELSKFCPSIYKSSKTAYKNAKKDSLTVRINANDMLNIEENSIDFALLEKTPRIKVVPSNIIWSDMGSFDSLYNELEKDKDNNAITTSITTSTININSKNNLIISSRRMIATVDVEDLIIVDTDDALLVSKKGSSQSVKLVVEELKKSKSELHIQHLTVHRPWGSYTVLLESLMYKIKKITVKPKAKLSLQKHFHRSEHWIVISGTALVTINDNKVLLKPNESTYIPIGAIHRLENPGLIPLEIIEAQVGEYLKEDDIVRVEDCYNRIEDFTVIE
jgi:mannose-1-phosphate guanylyltransferase